jgi:hypothetical protein
LKIPALLLEDVIRLKRRKIVENMFVVIITLLPENSAGNLRTFNPS